MPHPFEHDALHGHRPRRTRDPLVGTVLDDRYLIEARIATGGFGAIYRARAMDGQGPGAIVALKVLHPRLTGDPKMVARFRREGATLTRLHDPHTVTTLAVGETRDGTLYIAMELLTGETLHDRLRRNGALPWQAAVAIARAVCSSLAEAHALGVVHRDLKPENIHVEPRGDGPDRVKVIDFGIVKIERGSSIYDGKELTSAGHTIGTYDYMSPEQIVGSPCHDRSDIYSLGVVTYEMITGRRPFAQAIGPASMMTALLTRTPVPPAVFAAIPPELDGIVMRCLEREPQDRFADIRGLADAFDRLRARHRHPPAAVTAVHAGVEPIGGAGPAYDPDATLVDDARTWIGLERSTFPELERPRATSASEAPWVTPRADARGATGVARPGQRIAAGTGPVTPRRPAARYATLPGIAVATRPRDARAAHSGMPCPPAADPSAPLGGRPVPQARTWIPTPALPCAQLANDADPHLPARPGRTLGIAIAGFAAIVAGLAIVAAIAG